MSLSEIPTLIWGEGAKLNHQLKYWSTILSYELHFPMSLSEIPTLIWGEGAKFNHQLKYWSTSLSYELHFPIWLSDIRTLIWGWGEIKSSIEIDGSFCLTNCIVRSDYQIYQHWFGGERGEIKSSIEIGRSFCLTNCIFRSDYQRYQHWFGGRGAKLNHQLRYWSTSLSYELHFPIWLSDIRTLIWGWGEIKSSIEIDGSFCLTNCIVRSDYQIYQHWFGGERGEIKSSIEIGRSFCLTNCIFRSDYRIYQHWFGGRGRN